MTLPANIRVNVAAPFPAKVKGSGVVVISKTNGIWTIGLNFAAMAKLAVIADPANTYTLVWNALTGVYALAPASAFAAAKAVKILTAPGPYAAQPNDEVLIVKQIVAAPFTITVDWAGRTKALRVVDGKGDAFVNNISVTPTAGQSQLAIVNYTYIIDRNGGSIILTPLPDNSGAY